LLAAFPRASVEFRAGAVAGTKVGWTKVYWADVVLVLGEMCES